MKKIIYFLSILLVLMFTVSAQQSLSTNVDDYTNGKNGTASKSYTFVLDGSGKNALGKNTSSTNMGWSQWLNIKADGFNNVGLGNANTSGLSTSAKNAYTVKYNNNGGSGTINDDITSTTVVLPGGPTRTGYTFGGWYKESACTNKVGDAGATYTPTANITLYAKWTINKYTIAYDLNKGSGSVDGVLGANHPTSITWDQTFTVDHPTRTGYRFLGWDISGMDTVLHTIGGGSSNNTSLTKVVETSYKNLRSTSGTVTFKAQWEPIDVEYRVEHYQMNADGTKYTLYEYQVLKGKADATITPAVKNYTGFTSPETRTTTILPDGKRIVIYDYVRNSYTVEYDGNGATGGSTASSKHMYGVAKNLTSNGYTRAYTITYNYNGNGTANSTATATYTFKNWNTNAGGTGTTYTNGQSVTNLSTANNSIVKLYAQWTSASVTLPTPTRTGYTFGGWYTDATYATKIGNGGATYTPTSNITLYAKWDQSNTTGYTVKHYQMNLDGANYTLKETQNLTGPTGGTVSPATKIYEGFTAPSVQAVTIKADGSTVVNYYYTRNKYTFTLGTAAGVSTSGSTATGSYYYGATITLRASASSGYTWSKWDLITGNDITTANTTFVMPAYNETATPVTTKNTYTVTYNGNGNTGGSTASSTHEYGVPKALTANGFTREYTVTYNYNGSGQANTTDKSVYMFNKWNTKTDGTGTDYNDKQEVSTLATSGNVNLYAKWTSKSVTLPTPTRTGYTFSGWYKEAACTNKVGDAGAAYTPTANITLYAKWTAVNGTVYTVKHLKQDLDGTNYTIAGVEELSGTTNSSVTPNTKTYEGFTSPSKQTVTIKADGSTIVEYRYTRNSYTVTLTKGTGISSVTGAGTYKYEQKVSVNAVPSTGYSWSKWTGTKETTSQTYDFTMPASNVSLTANATAKNYLIKYEGNDVADNKATLSGISSTVTYYSTAVTNVTATRTGWTFAGWYTEKTGGTQVFNASNQKVTGAYWDSNGRWIKTEDVTLYAHWTAKDLSVSGNLYGEVFYQDISSALSITSIATVSNGTGSYSYSATKTGPLSISVDGKITVDGGVESNKYPLTVTATDTISKKTKSFTINIYVKPVQELQSGNQINVEVPVGDTNMNFFMLGLNNTANSATSALTNSLTVSSGLNLMSGTLKNAATAGATNGTISIAVVDKTFSYNIKITGVTKKLTVEDVAVTYTNADITPQFYKYSPNESAAYKNQADLFYWAICKKGETCNVGTRQDKVKNVLWGTGTDNKSFVDNYVLKIVARSTSSKPIEIEYLNALTGQSEFTSERELKLTVNPYDLGGDGSTITDNNVYSYSGSIIDPTPTVIANNISGNKTLTKNTDYIVVAKDEGTSGSLNYSVYGKGNYSGVKDFTITTTNVSIANSNIIVNAIPDQDWTGAKIEPKLTIIDKRDANNYIYLQEGVDYTVSYSNNYKVSDTNPTVTITGMGNYTGTRTEKFKIKARDFEVSTFDGITTYTGSATNGNASIKIAPLISKTPYEGITGATANPFAVVLTYNSTPKTVTLSNRSIENVISDDIQTFTSEGSYTINYSISAEGYNTKTGSIKVTINKASNTLEIYKDGIPVSTLVLNYPDSVTLNYKVSYVTGNLTSSSTITTISSVQADANTKIGTITISPKANTVSKSEEVKITIPASANIASASQTILVKINLSALDAVISNNVHTYDGQAHSFDMSIKNSSGTAVTGSTITYSYIGADGKTTTSTTKPSFKEVGTHTISYTIKKSGYEDLSGTATVIINPVEIQSNWFSLATTQYNYDGTAKKPAVNKTSNAPSFMTANDYSVSYKNNYLPGTATVTISGNGNFVGTTSLSFTIKADNIAMDPVNDIYTEYTGYPTNGLPNADGRDQYDYIKVITPSNATVVYSDTLPVCQEGYPDCTDDEKIYNYTAVPKFKDVGEHTVWYKITAAGYTTVFGQFKITITEKVLPVPTVYGDYIYTGTIQSPSWVNYNSKFMTIEGTGSAKNPGTYTATFKLTDPNVKWENSTSSTDLTRDVSWTIQNISIKDHEDIVYNFISYGEEKEIALEYGKLAFDRTGYEQIGWVDECDDTVDSTTGLYKRTCDYSTIYDLGSVIDGATVAKKASSAVPTNDTLETCSGDINKILVNGQCYNLTQQDAYDLYAVWSSARYRIAYNLCDDKGCGVLKDDTVSEVSYDVPFTVKSPTRIGYKFTGWTITRMDDTPHVIGELTTSETQFQEPQSWYESGERTISYKNLTSVPNTTVLFTANWEPIRYTIVLSQNVDTYREDCFEFEKDGRCPMTSAQATGSMANLRATFDIAQSLPANQYALEGYTFLGWSTIKNDIKDNGTRSCIKYADVSVPYAPLGNILDDKGNKEASTSCIYFQDSQDNVKNLSTIDGDTVVLYAQWQRNRNTDFTITYWKERIGVDASIHDSKNYEKVAVDHYKGETDSMVTVDPYQFNQALSATTLINAVLNDSSPADTTVYHGVYASKEKHSGVSLTAFDVSGNATSQLNNDYRGFTLQKTGDSSKRTNTYSYVIKPDGTLNIDVYYTRNNHSVTYNINSTIQQNQNNPDTREYQVPIVLKNPTGTGIKDGKNDEGGTDQNNTADFYGWFRDMTVYNNNIKSINGEVTTHAIGYKENLGGGTENLYARWQQYRYTNTNGSSWSWASWGKDKQ